MVFHSMTVYFPCPFCGSALRAQVVVQRLAADAEIPRNLRLVATRLGGLCPQLRSLLLGENRLAPFVGAALLRQGNPLLLSLADQVTLELAEGGQHGEHQVGAWIRAACA